MKAFYFGCVEKTGHFLWKPGPKSAYRSTTPWGEAPDAVLALHEDGCKKGSICCCSQPEGLAVLHRKSGWMALAFWDRSVDGRRSSNSVFFFEGDHDFAGMLTLARQYFPTVVERFSFEIVEKKRSHD